MVDFFSPKMPVFANVNLVGKIERRHQGNRRSAIYAQAQDLLLLDKQDKAEKVSRFVLHCEDLNPAPYDMGRARGEGREGCQRQAGEPGGEQEECDGGGVAAGGSIED